MIWIWHVSILPSNPVLPHFAKQSPRYRDPDALLAHDRSLARRGRGVSPDDEAPRQALYPGRKLPETEKSDIVNLVTFQSSPLFEREINPLASLYSSQARAASRSDCARFNDGCRVL